MDTREAQLNLDSGLCSLHHEEVDSIDAFSLLSPVTIVKGPITQ